MRRAEARAWGQQLAVMAAVAAGMGAAGWMASALAPPAVFCAAAAVVGAWLAYPHRCWNCGERHTAWRRCGGGR